jgi:hypothetical protein
MNLQFMTESQGDDNEKNFSGGKSDVAAVRASGMWWGKSLKRLMKTLKTVTIFRAGRKCRIISGAGIACQD